MPGPQCKRRCGMSDFEPADDFTPSLTLTGVFALAAVALIVAAVRWWLR